MTDPNNRKPILLFDGVCNLCVGSVQFVIQRDPEGWFQFASLQSEAGEQLLQEVGLERDDFDTVVLIQGEETFTKSEAALRVLRNLPMPWSLFWALKILPRPVRDGIYDWIASHRYQWFGQREVCMVPSEDISDRFLD